MTWLRSTITQFFLILGGAIGFWVLYWEVSRVWRFAPEAEIFLLVGFIAFVIFVRWHARRQL